MLTADRTERIAVRRVASKVSGPSFGRLAVKDKRRSHSSASCQSWSGDGRMTGRRLNEKTDSTALSLSLGFWQGRLEASFPSPKLVHGNRSQI